MLGNGVNLLILLGGRPGGRRRSSAVHAGERMSDPLPQAMVLTAIVITLGITRSCSPWATAAGSYRHDEVQDDLEDRRVRLRARAAS